MGEGIASLVQGREDRIMLGLGRSGSVVPTGAGRAWAITQRMQCDGIAGVAGPSVPFSVGTMPRGEHRTASACRKSHPSRSPIEGCGTTEAAAVDKRSWSNRAYNAAQAAVTRQGPWRRRMRWRGVGLCAVMPKRLSVPRRCCKCRLAKRLGRAVVADPGGISARLLRSVRYGPGPNAPKTCGIPIAHV